MQIFGIFVNQGLPAVEQTVDKPVIWSAMAFVWRHYSGPHVGQLTGAGGRAHGHQNVVCIRDTEIRNIREVSDGDGAAVLAREEAVLIAGVHVSQDAIHRGLETSTERSHTKNSGHSLRWRHNWHDIISNHQHRDCLLNGLFWCRSKKTSKLRVTGLCAGNSPGTGEFPAQMASNAENVSIWWRHHVSGSFYQNNADF